MKFGSNWKSEFGDTAVITNTLLKKLKKAARFNEKEREKLQTFGDICADLGSQLRNFFRVSRMIKIMIIMIIMMMMIIMIIMIMMMIIMMIMMMMRTRTIICLYSIDKKTSQKL